MNTKSFRTVSILMIVFGIMGVISSVATLGASTGTGVATVILSIVNCLLLAAAGFIGTKAVKTGDADKAGLCKKLGLALIALGVIGIVVSIITNANTTMPGVNPGMVMGMAVISGIISLILPVLYYLGARKFGE